MAYTRRIVTLRNGRKRVTFRSMGALGDDSLQGLYSQCLNSCDPNDSACLSGCASILTTPAGSSTSAGGGTIVATPPAPAPTAPTAVSTPSTAATSSGSGISPVVVIGAIIASAWVLFGGKSHSTRRA